MKSVSSIVGVYHNYLAQSVIHCYWDGFPVVNGTLKPGLNRFCDYATRVRVTASVSYWRVTQLACVYSKSNLV
jgi:hypothetical protein